MQIKLKKSRLIARLWMVFFATLNRYILRHCTKNTKKILIPTQLLLGDCILLVSLIQKAMHHHSNSQIIVAAPFYAVDVLKRLNLPVSWIVWDQKNISDLRKIRDAGSFEVAYIPFEKWGSVWACAFGAQNVVGFTFPDVNFHDRFLTKTHALPKQILPVSDWLMQLVPGDNPKPYTVNKELFSQALPSTNTPHKKVILHIGARNQNRRWLAEHWSVLAEKIRAKGIQVIWTYALNEVDWSRQIKKFPLDWDTEGKLSFDELISLIANVDAVISPDTGVAHICKLTATPSVVIYGQGNPNIHGNGEYWGLSPVKNIFLESIPCRSMQTIFGRKLEGIKRCDLAPNRCNNPYCQNDIHFEPVLKSLEELIN